MAFDNISKSMWRAWGISASFMRLPRPWNLHCALRLGSLQQCLLVLGFVPSWQESLRWALSCLEFSSGRARPSVLDLSSEGELTQGTVPLPLLEEAILAARLAGRYGPPATMPDALRHNSHVPHPPGTATAQKDDHFFLQTGLPSPLSLPSSSACPLSQCPLRVRSCEVCCTPETFLRTDCEKQRQVWPEEPSPISSFPPSRTAPCPPVGPTKPGLLREDLQRQGFLYERLPSGSGF